MTTSTPTTGKAAAKALLADRPRRPLTGDNHATATALAVQARIEDVHAELRPEDKATRVGELRAHRPTAMLGDGINDAPAPCPRNRRRRHRHGRHGRRHRHRDRGRRAQDVGLSLAVITVFVPRALFGALGLAAVVAIHKVIEVLIIANGVRAARYRGPPDSCTPGPALTTRTRTPA